MKAYIRPTAKMVRVEFEALVCGSVDDKETVDFTFTTSTPSIWDSPSENVME